MMALIDKGKLIFHAPGSDLKITSMKKPLVGVSEGVCELYLKKPGSYLWFISNSSGKLHSQPFKCDHTTKIELKIRDRQFTIVVKLSVNGSNNSVMFIGTLKNKSDIDSLKMVIEDARKGSESPVWISAKENIKTPNSIGKINTSAKNANLDLVNNKTSQRTPLNTISGSPLRSLSKFYGKSLFPSPKQLSLQKSPSSEDSGFGKLDEKPLNNKPLFETFGGSYAHSRVSKTYLNKAGKMSALQQNDSISRSTLTKQKQYKDDNVHTENNNTLVGFSNLGNTCYMNSVLQCLLNIPNFFQDLNNFNNLECVGNNSLYNSLCNLGILKYSYETLQNQRFALQRVKDAISAAAGRFSGYSQHDAHEFLCHCLDELKENLQFEIDRRQDVNNMTLTHCNTCPIKENFESTVTRTISCQNCNTKVLKNEICHDFSLVIPVADENRNPKDLELHELLDRYFDNEIIEYSCEKCNSKSSLMSQSFQKLPRVLILHVKRYDMYDMKRTDNIILPKFIELSRFLKEDTVFPPTFTYSKDKFKFTTENYHRNRNSPEKRKSVEPLENEPLNKSAREVGFNAETSNDISDNTDNLSQSEKYTKVISLKPSSLKDDRSSRENFVEKSNCISSFTKDDDDDEQYSRAVELSLQEYQKELQTKENKLPLSNITHVSEDDETNIGTVVNDRKSLPLKNGFRLVGVINHHGQNTATGHYTSDSYDFKSKQWRNYNDSSVKDVKEHEVRYGRKESAYIVFYMHASCFDAIANR